MIELKGKNGTAKVFTDNIDDGTIGQIIGMMNERITENNTVRIMPDTHYGKGSTIGTTIKLNDEQKNWKVSPNVVGVESQALDTYDNKEAMNVVTKHFITVEETPSEDDLHF